MSKIRDRVFAEGVAQAAPSLAIIRQTAQEARTLEIQIAALATKQELLQKQLNAIKIGKLPALMDAAGMPSFTLADGTEVEVKEFCSGSLPKDPKKRKAALAWLRANEGDSLIKTEISLAFGRMEGKIVKKVLDALKKIKIQPTVETGVHPQTLMAYARERLENGDSIDLDKLGLYAGKVAKFKLSGDA